MFFFNKVPETKQIVTNIGKLPNGEFKTTVLRKLSGLLDNREFNTLSEQLNRMEATLNKNSSSEKYTK